VTRLPLTKNEVTLLFKRIRERAGITEKPISPHIFRHSFAIRYLMLGQEDMTTVKNYMHMNNEAIQSQKRKYGPDNHLYSRMPGPRESRRR
jgi:integrase/recombinase XerD